MDLAELLDTTLTGLGYVLVDWERSAKGTFIRIFIDKPQGSADGASDGNAGINVDDCAAVSHHLTRVLTVENVNYERLEVSSPGLDRPLKKERDFVRFAGQKARVRLRVAMDGQRNFVGVLGEVNTGRVTLLVEGKTVVFDLANLDKARLAPEF